MKRIKSTNPSKAIKVAWTFILFLAVPASAETARPNILIIVGDDHAGGTLGIDGDPRNATPNLDRLARQGVRFDRAYCNSPVCTPSRQSFITGRLPHAVGVTQLRTPLPDEAITLGERLRDQGYETAAFGKMHFNRPVNHGFDRRLDTKDWLVRLKSMPPGEIDARKPWRPFVAPANEWLNAACEPFGLREPWMETTFYADQAVSFIREKRSRPFLLVVGFYDPHSPFRFPSEFADRYRVDMFDSPRLTEFDLEQRPLVFSRLKDDEIRGIQAAYYSSIAFVDRHVGRIVDAVDDAGLGRETIVVYLGDNGYMRGHHGRFEKHCFYEPAVRVPFLIRQTGKLKEDLRVREQVELVDLQPTLLELAGVPNPPDGHGLSLARIALGEAAKGREYVFSEYLENEEAMIRSSRYKLVVGTGRRERQDGYQTGRPLEGPYLRLYDTEADPNEDVNLADRSEYALIVDEHLNQMYRRFTTTREGLPPLPLGLDRLQTIHHCLVPRDPPPPETPKAKARAGL